MKALPLILLMALCLVAAAYGQGLPDAPGLVGHGADKAFFFADAILKTADFAVTHRVLASGSGCSTVNAAGQPYLQQVCHHPWELDPIARPFVMHGTGLQAAYFAGSWALDTIITFELRKHRHARMARMVQGFAIAASAWGIETSATH